MSYRGEIALIPAGRGGLDLNQNAADIPITALTRAEGIVFEDGVWRKEPGAVSFDAGIIGAPVIAAGFDWWPTTATQRIITAALDGKLYKEVGGDLDAITLASGLSTTARGQLVPGGQEAAGGYRKLFYFNGVDAVRVLTGDGAAATVITNPPADWSGSNQPLCGAVHGPRLWGCGNVNAPHRLYGSGPDKHEDFLCAGSLTLPVFSGVGQRLVAGVTFKDLFWLFKFPHGIFWLDDRDPRITNWELRLHTAAVGVAESPSAALAMDNDVLFLAADGSFHLLSATTTGGAEKSDLSAALHISKWLRDNLNLSRLSQVQSCWFSQKQLAIFSLPRAGATTNTARLLFDFFDVPRGGPVKFSYSFRDSADALFLRRGSDTVERPMFGDNAGKVWSMDQATRSKDGVGYSGEYETPETDFSYSDPALAVLEKHFAELEVETNVLGAGTLTVESRIDGTLTQTLSFDLSKRLARQRLLGSGEKLSLRGRNSVAGVDFSVVRHRVYFTRGAGSKA